MLAGAVEGARVGVLELPASPAFRFSSWKSLFTTRKEKSWTPLHEKKLKKKERK